MKSSQASPYADLPEKAFWSPAVAQKNPLAINDLWTPKYAIGKQHVIATAGSCFAQHIGRALQQNGYSWLDSEPAPETLTAEEAKDENYGVFTFRTGNIYTAALLNQWLEWALDVREQDTEEVWRNKAGKYVDPFRPNISAEGFETHEAMLAARNITLKAIKDAVLKMDVFVFTLGLTEAWVNAKSGVVYPMCPGTIGGEFDPELHKFVNYQYPEIRKTLRKTFDLLKSVNPSLRFLLTTSPVPLTATASSEHVLIATMHSKSILRAVAGDIRNTRKDTDYFPSYEIISSFPFKAMFYQPNLRSVAPEGVAFVMQSFFRGQDKLGGSTTPIAMSKDEEVVCEEVLLEAFASKSEPSAGKASESTHNVCVAGTSHVGALSTAWREALARQHAETSLTFFAVAAPHFHKIKVENGIAYSSDDNVRESFRKSTGYTERMEIDQFDSFVVHGLGFPMQVASDFLEKQEQELSEEALTTKLIEHLKGLMRTNPLIRLATDLRGATTSPICLSEAPMESILAQAADPGRYDRVRKLGPVVLERFWTMLEEFLEPFDISVIRQPAQTLDNSFYTKEEYALGYGRVEKPNHGHTNSDYGALVIPELLKRSIAA